MSLVSPLSDAALETSGSKRLSFAHPVFVSSAIDALELQPAPIEPSWILSGAPEASARLHSESADRLSSTTVWACTAGAFRWRFGWDETVVIISGSVLVTDETGAKTTLKAGDVGYFAAGSWATWEIDDHVRKVAFCRRPVPTPVAMALTFSPRLARLLRKIVASAGGRPVMAKGS